MTKRVAIVLGVLAGVVLIGAAVAFAVISNVTNQGREELLETTQASGFQRVIEFEGERYEYNDAMASILFLGIDAENGRLKDGTNGQADAIMLLALDTESGSLSCIAIPRETIVSQSIESSHGGHEHEIETYLCLIHNEGSNEAEGSERMCRTVSNLLDGIPIDHYYTLNLSGIGELTNAIGGIDLTALSDVAEAGITAGQEVHLEGDAARDYVWRRDWENDDLSPADRLARQRQFLECFARKTLQETKRNPFVLFDLFATAEAHSYSDLSSSELAYLGSVLSENGTSSIEIMTIPGTMAPVPNAPTKYLPDAAGITQIVLETFYTKA